jgi:hypothetical protein
VKTSTLIAHVAAQPDADSLRDELKARILKWVRDALPGILRWLAERITERILRGIENE